MIKISSKDRFSVHDKDFVKRYARTSQRPRILLSRSYVDMALKISGKRRPTICEIGCGALDICGPYAIGADVVGYDFHQKSVDYAISQYANAKVYCKNINTLHNISCDILVACEVLEHVDYPVAIMDQITKSSKILIISHPIDESENSKATKGEHCWSFSENDFNAWFEPNGFKIMNKEYFKNGPFNTLIGIGVRP